MAAAATPMWNPFRGSLVARRPTFMYVASHAPKLAAACQAARWAWLVYLGAPATPLFVLLAWRYTTASLTHIAVGAVVVWFGEWASSTLYTPWGIWRKTWAIRRLWPSRFTAADYGTDQMRASLGGGGISSFLQSSGKLPHPVLNHPALGFWPRIDRTAQTVTFRVWPPGAPGAQTVDDLEQMVDSICAGYHFAHRVTLDTDVGDHSWGWLTFDLTPPDDGLTAVSEELFADLNPDGDVEKW